jgi:cell division protein FtsQ
MFFMITVIAGIAVVAAEWRQHVTGVELDIRGLRNTSLEDITAAVALTDSCSLASLDLLDLRMRILENPYIRNVDLKRNPPRTLLVSVTERKPIAMLINVQGSDWLLDDDGYILPAAHAPRVYDLPVITGAGELNSLEAGVRIVNRKIHKALMTLRHIRAMGGGIVHLFSEINVSHQKDMVLYTLEAGVPVIFGPAWRIDEKLHAFGAFWENVAMKYDPASLEYVDLRWQQQVVTRWRGHQVVSEEPEEEEIVIADTLYTFME